MLFLGLGRGSGPRRIIVILGNFRMICFVGMEFMRIMGGNYLFFFSFSLFLLFICLTHHTPHPPTTKILSKYEGEFKQDHMNGFGELTFEDGTYAGEFKKGEFDGVGVREWNDGRYYKGSWRKVSLGRGFMFCFVFVFLDGVEFCLTFFFFFFFFFFLNRGKWKEREFTTLEQTHILANS